MSLLDSVRKLTRKRPAVTAALVRESADEWLRSTVETPLFSGVTPEGLAYIDTKPRNTNDGTLKFDSHGNPVQSDFSTSSHQAKPGVTLLLAHGYGLGYGMWAANLDHLASLPGVSRVVAFDWRGMGGSERLPIDTPATDTKTIRWSGRHWLHSFGSPAMEQIEQATPSVFSRVSNSMLSSSNPLVTKVTSWMQAGHKTPTQAIDYLLDPVPALYKHLSLAENPVVLVGHSLGGYLSTLFALKHPQLVQSLVLASPAGVPIGMNSAIRVASSKEYQELVDYVRADPTSEKLLHDIAAKVLPSEGLEVMKGRNLSLIDWLWQLNLTHKDLLAVLPSSLTEKVAAGMSHRLFGDCPEGPTVTPLLETYLQRLLQVPTGTESALNSLLAMDMSVDDYMVAQERRNKAMQNVQASSLLNSADAGMKTASQASTSSTASSTSNDTKKDPQALSRDEHVGTSAMPLRPNVYARIPLQPLLGSLKMPVHLLYGSHDWLAPSNIMDIMNNLRKEADDRNSPYKPTLTILGEAGHHLYSNNARAFHLAIGAAVDMWKPEVPKYDAISTQEYLASVLKGSAKTVAKVELMDNSDGSAGSSGNKCRFSLLKKMPKGSLVNNTCKYAQKLFGRQYKPRTPTDTSVNEQ